MTSRLDRKTVELSRMSAACQLSWLAALMGSLLCACTAPDAAKESDHQHSVRGTGISVTVLDVGDQIHAFPFAEQYCETLGRTAEFRRMTSHRHRRYATAKNAEFDCVPTPPGNMVHVEVKPQLPLGRDVVRLEVCFENSDKRESYATRTLSA